jgi:hypothetical protein
LDFLLKYKAAVASALCAVAAFPVAASCGAAFCSINTSWDVQGAWAGAGSRLDLRYEAVTQDRPRSGSRNVAFGQQARHHDEVITRNRNWIATYDHAFDADWGIAASLPQVDREHFHVHNHRGAALPEAWDFRAAGDLRLLARRHLWSVESKDPPAQGASGVNFGLKLPTGRFNLRNDAGALAERSLQPGTGTTDLLLGAYTAYSLPLKNLSWFAQGLLQQPLNARDGYRPGRRVGLDTGLRYDLDDRWSLMLQANLVLKGRDKGVAAESADIGGSSLWLGPGASFALSDKVRLYGFIQAPLAQHVNGVQLVARRTAVLGVSAMF